MFVKRVLSVNTQSGNSIEKPVLLIIDGVQRGQQWSVDSERVVIGRGPECQVVIPDRSVSREHAEILLQDGKFLIQDLGSKNGTYVNGIKVNVHQELRDGDEIQVAISVIIKFIGSDATVPLTIEGAEPHVSGLQLYPHTHEVYIDGTLLDPPLSLYQYRLLELLCERKGGIVTRDEVVRTVWPEAATEGVSEQAIDALVRRLRDRLGELSPEVTHITTVRGHGFRMLQSGDHVAHNSDDAT
jgi:DNA-binding winged helix-turn-helix (wHTH) protein